MKQLVLTGIAQETTLQDPETTHLMLVFNNGELRLPTDDVGLNYILSYLGNDKAAEADEEEADEELQAQHTADEYAQWLATQADAGTDDDEEYDVDDGVGSI